MQINWENMQSLQKEKPLSWRTKLQKMQKREKNTEYGENTDWLPDT